MFRLPKDNRFSILTTIRTLLGNPSHTQQCHYVKSFFSFTKTKISKSIIEALIQWTIIKLINIWRKNIVFDKKGLNKCASLYLSFEFFVYALKFTTAFQRFSFKILLSEINRKTSLRFASVCGAIFKFLFNIRKIVNMQFVGSYDVAFLKQTQLFFCFWGSKWVWEFFLKKQTRGASAVKFTHSYIKTRHWMMGLLIDKENMTKKNVF